MHEEDLSPRIRVRNVWECELLGTFGNFHFMTIEMDMGINLAPSAVINLCENRIAISLSNRGCCDLW